MSTKSNWSRKTIFGIVLLVSIFKMTLGISYASEMETESNVIFCDGVTSRSIQMGEWIYWIGEDGLLYRTQESNGQQQLLYEVVVRSFSIDVERNMISVLTCDENLNYVWQQAALEEWIFSPQQEKEATERDEYGISLFSLEEEKAQNEAYIYQFLTETMQLNTAAASGVLANIQCECSFLPDARSGGGTGYGTYDDGHGYGICQWTYYTRKYNLKDWCEKNIGPDSYQTLEGQLLFMKYEFETSYIEFYNQLRAVSNDASGAYQAAYLMCYSYEKPYYFDKEFNYSGVIYPSESDYRGCVARDVFYPKYCISNEENGEIGTPAILEQYAMVDGSILVSWEQVAYADAYYVYRKVEGGDWSQVAATADCQYVDKTTVNGTTYIYTVRAWNQASDKKSEYEAGSAITARKVIPTLQAIWTDDDQAGLCTLWEAVDYAEKYYVYRKEVGGNWKRIAEIPATDHSYRDFSAYYGTTYTYTVRAYCNYNGTYLLSGYDNIGLTGKQDLATTHLTAAIAMANGNVMVTWQGVIGADAYYVYRKLPGGSWKRIAATTDCQYVDKTAVNGTTYLYTVRAWNQISNIRGGYESGIRATAKIVIPTLQAIWTDINESGLCTLWEPVDYAEKYYIYRKEVGGNWKKIAEISAADHSYRDFSANYGTTYLYTVRAYCNYNGTYLLSGYDAAGLKGKQNVATVHLLEATSLTNGNIFVSGQALVNVEKYYIYRKVVGGSWKKIAVADTCQYVDKTAVNGTTYLYTIRAWDQESNTLGAYESGISATARKVAPELINIYSQSGNVIIQWGAVSDAVNYYIYRKMEGGSWKKIGTVDASTFTWTDTTATIGNTYLYTVKAHCQYKNLTNDSGYDSKGLACTVK